MAGAVVVLQGQTNSSWGVTVVFSLVAKQQPKNDRLDVAALWYCCYYLIVSVVRGHCSSVVAAMDSKVWKMPQGFQSTEILSYICVITAVWMQESLGTKCAWNLIHQTKGHEEGFLEKCLTKQINWVFVKLTLLCNTHYRKVVMEASLLQGFIFLFNNCNFYINI